jgi:hypothetical protein
MKFFLSPKVSVLAVLAVAASLVLINEYREATATTMHSSTQTTTIH